MLPVRHGKYHRLYSNAHPTSIRGEKKSLTRVYSLMRDTIKSALQPLKCHGDKGRLSPSRRRRNAYVLSRAGVPASRGVARRLSCVRAARPRFPVEKPHFPRD